MSKITFYKFCDKDNNGRRMQLYLPESVINFKLKELGHRFTVKYFGRSYQSNCGR